MENISSVLGSAGRNLDIGRNTVSCCMCGDKEQGFSSMGFSPSPPPAVAPVDFSSFEPILHRGSGGYMGRDGKIERNIGTTPQKTHLETLRSACRRLTQECSQDP